MDDQVAASDWEQDLYRMGVPPDVEVRLRDCRRRGGAPAPEWQADPRPGILLTADIETMAALSAQSPTVWSSINLGGLHHRPGRSERLPYVYLTDEELRTLEALEAAGTEMTAQDLPTTAAVPLEALG